MNEYHFFVTYDLPTMISSKRRVKRIDIITINEESAFKECINIAYGDKKKDEGVFDIELFEVI